MENKKDSRRETWLMWLWAVVFCFCVISLATGCTNAGTVGTEDPSSAVSGSLPGEDSDGVGGAGESEAYQIVSENGPGSSPEDPIAAEPGMRLLEGVYYVADIDDETDEEVFCYLGSQDNGFPRFYVAEQYPFILEEAQLLTLSGGETEIKLEPGMMYSADLDGDGAAETFAYCGLASGGNTSGYTGGNSTLYPTFWIDGQLVQSGYLQGDGYTPEMIDDWGNVLEGQQFYLCDIRRGDGWLELATLDPGPSGDPVTTFLRWDGEGLQMVGRVADFPFAQEWTTLAEEYANGTYGLDGRGNVTIQARADILQTWWVKETWTLDRKTGHLTLAQPKDGLFENTDPYYYREYSTSGDDEENGAYPHLLQDLPLYQKQDLSSEVIVMAAADHGVENKIYLTHTDNVHWVRVEDDAGTSGWIYLENFGDLILPEGKKKVYDYIGGLNMAD